jgi:hypothetical protein
MYFFSLGGCTFCIDFSEKNIYYKRSMLRHKAVCMRIEKGVEWYEEKNHRDYTGDVLPAHEHLSGYE